MGGWDNEKMKMAIIAYMIGFALLTILGIW